jgi:protein SCO1/2
MRTMSRFNGWLVLVFALLALLSWGVGERSQALADGPQAGYFPDVTLKTQDDKDVRFYEDLIKGKIALINVMYTDCDGTLCKQGMENLVKVQKALGDRLGREVFMYSITLDPAHDTPAVLRKYAKTYGVKPGWTLLTGKAEDIEKLRRKLGMFNSDPKLDADRTQHTGMIRICNEAINKWTTASVLSKPERILELIERVKPPRRSPK